MGDFGIEVLTKLLSRICNSGYIYNDLLKSTCIALLKKAECDNRHAISPVSQTTRLLLRIILKKVRGKIKTRNEW